MAGERTPQGNSPGQADADEVDGEDWLTRHWAAVLTDMDPARLAREYRAEAVYTLRG